MKRIVKRPALKREHTRDCLNFVRKYREWTEEMAKSTWLARIGLHWIHDDTPRGITPRSVQGTATLRTTIHAQILQEELHMSVQDWGFAIEEIVFRHDNDP